MADSLFSKFFQRTTSTISVDGTAFSAAEMHRAIASHRLSLREHGAVPGDVVGVWTQRDVRTIVALVAHLLEGVVTVPLNPALGTKELSHVLSDSKPKLLFAADTASVFAGTLPIAPDRDASLPPRGDRLLDHNPMLILYTSGTTGMPKGAVLSAHNVMSNLDALASAWALSERDTVVHALPLFHVHGLCVGLFGALRAGAAIHWLTRFEPQVVAQVIADTAENSQAVLYAVPTMYHRLVELAERDPGVARSLSRARLLVSGSAPLSTREHERIFRATGLQVRERYGLTETLINTAVRSTDPPRVGWVGPPVEGVELQLVNEQREPVIKSDGEMLGEVRVRGANVFIGYLNRPDATEAVRDESGWFYTGDIAVRSPDGWVKIVGRRATDLIKSGGYKIGAGEIESALLEHPDVQESAVVSVEDPDLGEKIVAFVVLRTTPDPEHKMPTETELADWVASTLTPHKRPRKVVFVDQLPRNAMGKVLKNELKASLAKQS